MSVLLKQIKIPKPNVEQRDKFPFTLPLYQDGLVLNFDKSITILAGENASGKSTLLESLSVSCGFPIQGGAYGHIGRKTYGTNNFGEEIVIEPDNLDLGKSMQLSWAQRYNGRGFFFRAEYMTETLAQFAKANHYLSVLCVTITRNYTESHREDTENHRAKNGIIKNNIHYGTAYHKIPPSPSRLDVSNLPR